MKRVSVIANCHCWPLAQALSMMCSDITADHILINNLNGPDLTWNDKLRSLRQATSDDVVFTFPLGEDFGLAETDRLRGETAARVFTFSNIRFDGLHPDMTYFGRRGVRRSGFLGEYHSKIILASYASGLSRSECVSKFNDNTYSGMAFYETFDSSREELYRRDAGLDIKFARSFISLTCQRRTMLTFNHPTSEMLMALSNTLAQHSGIGSSSLDSECFPNPLASSYIWPIYPEIVSAHCLPYKGSYDFILPTHESKGYSSRVITLDDFVRHSYSYYEEKYDIDSFTRAVEELDFYQSFRATLGLI